MFKRSLVVFSAPALLAGGLLLGGAGAASAEAPPVLCQVKVVSPGNASLAQCRHSREYGHWIECQDRSGKLSVELTKTFTGTRNTLSCASGYRLLHHSIGV
jgi:hypothetical protein